MAEPFASLKAALADRYCVECELGHGGMAIIYLAQDLKHDRPVALKVLRPELAAALGPERFLREVRITARLNHPHILPLLDSGKADEFLYYAMPYVEGESLRVRLGREKQLPLDDALQIAREVADALSYAHSHGVVHRDIKPENVLLESGHAVVADFGIARAITAAGGDRLTETGIALGTPAYMSPEQAAGSTDLDGRSDLYSLGCVLYEMLAGRPPFVGPTLESVVHQHLTIEPQTVTTIRPAVPGWVAAALSRALAKTPADRFNPVALFGEAIMPRPLPAAPGGSAPARRRGRMLWIGLAAGVVVAAGSFAVWRLSTQPPAPAIGRSTHLTTDPGLEIQPAISPDAKLVAYAAGNATRMRIFLRPVGGGRTIPLSDDSTAVETQPRWSPDGSQLLFLSRGGVSVSPALGGMSRPVIPRSLTAVVRAAAWSPDGREIAFVRAESLLVTPVNGDRTRFVATSRDAHSCTWSPDGRWIACVVLNPGAVLPGPGFGNLAPSAIDLFPAAGGTAVRVVEPTAFDQSPTWTRGGRLLFVSDREGPRDVYALDLASSGKPRGAPARLTTGLGALSISLSADDSRLTYAVYTARANIWSLPIPAHPPVTIADATRITSGTQVIEAMRVSWDRNWLLYDSNLRGNSDIYRIPLAGGEPEQLTSHPADEFAPDLSPDGRLLAYHSWRTGTRDIEVKPLDGGPVQRLTDTPAQESYPRWSPDGRAIVFLDQVSPGTLYVLHRTTAGGWSARVRLAAEASPCVWSPDGRWIAYVGGPSPEGTDIMVVPASGGPARRLNEPSPVAGTADWVEWDPDGRRLYYKAHDAEGRASFWAVDAGGGTPRLLVRFPDPDRQSHRIEFTTGGKRFYFAIEDRESDVWVAELRKQ